MSNIYSIISTVIASLLLAGIFFIGSINTFSKDSLIPENREFLTDYVKVDSPEGLNVRDYNCNWKAYLNNNQILRATKYSDKYQNHLITFCNINGVDYTMRMVSNNFMHGYVAVDFIKDVEVSEYIDGDINIIDFYVNSLDGLNIRGENCNKIGTIGHKDILSKRNTYLGENFRGSLYAPETTNEINCTLGGKVYPLMEFYVPSLGKTGFAATEFVN